MPSRTTHNFEAEASRKRVRRPGGQDDDEDSGEVQLARSRSHTEPRKRVRLSDANEDHPSTPTNSDSDTADDDENAAPPQATPPKSQYELMRDNNFDHLRHEAADDQRATQRLRFRPNLLGDNAIADNGIIESVTCVNFMCHQRLHCELGPLLNFIVGENGSGKSAILTAITLCLGGKASSTNRGGSLKSFIKEGCDRSFLAVKLKNKGQDAYKPDIYGESIIVERHFTKSGSSGFKVKTALGQTHSTKKQEVDEIVEYYALQVDNPLNVLSQDNARQFLNASTKTQKYKFFIEGVQLQQLDNDYRLISESLEQMVAKIPDQEERVQHAREAFEKAKRMREELDGNRQSRIKLRTLRNQLAWAQVVEAEQELRNRQQDLAEIEIKAADVEREMQEKNQALLLADEKVERAQETLQFVKEEEGEIQQRVEDAHEAWQRLRKEIAGLHVEERDAHEALKVKTNSIKDTEKKISAEEKRLQEANGEAHTIKLRELDDANEKVKATQQELQETKDRRPIFAQNEEQAKQNLDRIAEKIQPKQREIANVEDKIKAVEENSSSLYAGYEAGIPNLLKMIDANERSFESKPIGPLGAHIQLLKPEWGPILETTFGGNLGAFLVTSRRDEKTLRGFINRVGIKNCPVFICNQQPLNLDGKEPDPEYDTILRVLKIDNTLVRDQLIIHHMIEQVILVPERTRAQQVMFDGAPPRNVKACLSWNEGKRGEALRLVGGNNGISSTPVRPKPHLRGRMKTDSHSQLAFLKETLKQVEAEYRELDAERRRLQQHYQRCKTERTQQENLVKTLESRLRHEQVAVDKIREDLDQFDGADGRLQGLKEILEDLKEQQNHVGIQYGTLRAKKQDKSVEEAEAHRKFKDEKKEAKDYEERLRKAEAKLKQAQDLRHISLIEKNDIISRAAEYAEQKRVAEARCARRQGHIEDMIKEAQRISPERVYIPEGETHDSIMSQYNELRARLERIDKKRGMSEAEVLESFEQTKKMYDTVVDELESSKRVNERLRETLSLRLDKWRKFQRYISSQSRANFIYLLSERGFRGKLLLDHERKALDLQVEPDRTERRAAGRSTKTLSGGEKSFSSICLLLAIWEAMGSPLRCLDEFDVFMDNVNRAISTNMLITAARRSVNRQYIFITPNAIEGRNTLDKDVKIIRLTDPRQRTLTDY
ncbi:Structural maintenance of chromosomes protein 6 [Madurella fahalii]|uniref:Structural maintenance of chromosomes protein 6 n=1 Tax=Madurella fahalii TaxID=1157608 RepID=A0ABQ0GHQ1_9PEZI